VTANDRPVESALGIADIEGGFPHSEILGSKLVRSSPRLIAAYHVLHRLSAPRHPPDTLKALDRSHYQCPPLGRGCRLAPVRGTDVGIDRKTSLLQTHPRASRSSHAHMLVARLWPRRASGSGCVSSLRCKITTRTGLIADRETWFWTSWRKRR
jgi:hypothetical protein